MKNIDQDNIRYPFACHVDHKEYDASLCKLLGPIYLLVYLLQTLIYIRHLCLNNHEFEREE